MLGKAVPLRRIDDDEGEDRQYEGEGIVGDDEVD